MAKYLTDELELQSIANAIRAKNKSQESLEFPTDFVSAIANLPSGGNIEEDGNGNLTFSTDGDTVGKMPLTVSANGTYTPPAGKAYSVVEVNLGKPSAKDVNFYDYDGTLVASYTTAEFANISALPDNPTHEGLTAQGWNMPSNWTLADAKTYISTNKQADWCQMYITTDGKTRVHIHLEQGRTSPMLGVCPNGTVDVDWGDGTAHDTLTGNSTSTVQWTNNHNYAAPGDYIIKLTVTGSMRFYGNNSSNQYSGLLRYASSEDGRNYVYRNAIQKVEIGNGVTSIGSYAFYYCYNLTSITIPSGVTSIDNYAFSRCFNLMSITIPNSVTSIGNYAFNYSYSLTSITIPSSVTSISNQSFGTCYSLASVTIHNGVTSISDQAFSSCYSLTKITIPASVTSIGEYAFSNCYSLANITIPTSVTRINESVFYNCYSLANIAIPASVTRIDNYVFGYCYGLAKLHFKPSSPPTLSNTSAFTGISADCIIYVPYSSDHSILEAYKTATNWSTYASYM